MTSMQLPAEIVDPVVAFFARFAGEILILIASAVIAYTTVVMIGSRQQDNSETIADKTSEMVEQECDMGSAVDSHISQIEA